MCAFHCRPAQISRRLAALALVGTLVTCFAIPGVGTAGSSVPPVAWPLSTECHKALNAFAREERWLAEHFDQDLPLAEFEQHQALMKRAWYTSEVDCGIDVDQDGVTGYRTGKRPVGPVTRHRP